MILYDTLTQPLFILALFVVGFSCGFIIDLKNLILSKAKHKKFFVHILDFFAVLIIGFSLYLTNLRCHYGILRVFPLLVFFASFYLQRLLSQKVFAKFLKKCYTLIERKKHGTKKH